jgi:hypothetical protein
MKRWNAGVFFVAKKTFALAFLLFTAPAWAVPLADVEVACWSSGVDEGAWFCQHVMVTGRVAGETGYRVPELAAPDAGGPETRLQADRACGALGLPYALDFARARASRDTDIVKLHEGARSGELARGLGTYIQHLRCGG